MRDKVGILTFHDTNNFGSWLQTYGLYKKLCDLGVNVEIIDYQCKEIIKREKLTWDKSFKLLQQKDLLVYQFLWKTIKKQIWLYIYSRTYLRKSAKRYNRSNIKESNSIYDIFLIGSDLVWDTRITNSDFTYMLDFVDDGRKKLSYAASLGFEKIPESQREKYKRLLKEFYCITVREKTAKNVLQDLTNDSVFVVSDPTMLLSKQKWLSFVNKKNKYGHYILVYFIDDKNEILRLAKQYAREHKCQVIIISEGKINNENCVAPNSISQFLSLIFHAEKIFTASYHGILFSLYFEKQLAFAERAPKNRMDFVADKFGIEECEIHHKDFDLEKTINYKEITPEIKKFRKKSIKLLKKMVNI